MNIDNESISLEQTDLKLPLNTIGIDMGQSLTKMAFIEGDNIILSTFQTRSNIENINNFLETNISNFEKFNFTGGRAFNPCKSFLRKIETNLFNEFETNTKGVEFLYTLNKKKKLPPALIVTIGTGTSIILKKQGFQHVGGSAIGGGFFMALIKLLFEKTDFNKAINLAKKGNRYNVDLKVSDIYHPEDQRVDMIFREFTAATLGKVDDNYDLKNLKCGDFTHSIINTIGENIGTMACLMAENNDVENILFCGGFLKDNRLLKKMLSLICKVNKKKGIFVNKSEYNGAIGALLC